MIPENSWISIFPPATIDTQKEVNGKKTAIAFWLYSNFYIGTEDSEETVINKVIDRAYQDATAEGAYNTRLYDDMNNPADAQKKERKRCSDDAKKNCAEFFASGSVPLVLWLMRALSIKRTMRSVQISREHMKRS